MTDSIISPTHFEQGFTEHTCTICDYSYTDSITEVVPHAFGTWQIHDSQTHYKTCDCGETITENHSWDEGSITTEPTIDSEGIKTFICTQCGAIDTQTLNLFPFQKTKVRKNSFFGKSQKQVKPAMPILSLLCAPLPLCFVSLL